jgi:hypothetical protein
MQVGRVKTEALSRVLRHHTVITKLELQIPMANLQCSRQKRELWDYELPCAPRGECRKVIPSYVCGMENWMS